MRAEPQRGIPIVAQSFAGSQPGQRGNAPAFGEQLLTDRYSTLPISEASQGRSDQKSGGETRGENVSPSSRGAATFGNEVQRIPGRDGRAIRPGSDPSLGFFKGGGAQQQTPRARPPGLRPSSGLLTELRVLADPDDIRIERLRKPIGAGVEAGFVFKEDEIQASQRRRYRLVFGASMDNRRQPLVQRLRKRNLSLTNIRSDGVRAQHEYDGVGLGDQGFDTLPPVLQRVDFGAVDRGNEATLPHGRFDPIGKRRVFSRIRNED